jgi:glucan phosphoethanolaminetransferase (alkaline phosphatase superfamily)
VTGARRTNVILVIIDSLRADHMQVYGYARPTTPFLSQLVSSGRMKQVQNAFSTCSESFCGITSTLSSREFRDISAPTFDLQDALRDEGYRTWFLLSGNHSAWNGLPEFYHASDDTYFDGSRTQRYTMDDDRLVLEGLERVPPALPRRAVS